MKTRTVNTHPWSTLEKKLAPERLARIKSEVDQAIPGHQPSAEALMDAERENEARIFCAIPWPACPTCIGEFSIVSTAGTDTCRGCGRTWPTAANAVCGRTATHRIFDNSGGFLCVCDAHAALARRQVVDAVVTPIDAGR